MSKETHDAVLHQTISNLKAEGYDVFLEPNKLLTPYFLENLHPDAIAIRGDGNLLIEVTSPSETASPKLEKFRQALEGRPDWELRVILIPPEYEKKQLKVQQSRVITNRLSEIEKLAAEGYFVPCVILAWSTLEAISRRLLPRRFERPQTPGRIVEVLASLGRIEPADADFLRALADKRNKLVHGEFDVGVDDIEISRTLKILKDIVLSARDKF